MEVDRWEEIGSGEMSGDSFEMFGAGISFCSSGRVLVYYQVETHEIANRFGVAGQVELVHRAPELDDAGLVE